MMTTGNARGKSSVRSPRFARGRVGKTDQALNARPARGAGRRDTPLVGTSGRELPVIGHARHVVVVHLHDFAGVFDRHLLGAGEIREYVVAGSMTPRTPFRRAS